MSHLTLRINGGELEMRGSTSVRSHLVSTNGTFHSRACAKPCENITSLSLSRSVLLLHVHIKKPNLATKTTVRAPNQDHRGHLVFHQKEPLILLLSLFEASPTIAESLTNKQIRRDAASWSGRSNSRKKGRESGSKRTIIHTHCTHLVTLYISMHASAPRIN